MAELMYFLIGGAIKAVVLAAVVTLISQIRTVRNHVSLQHSLWLLVILAMVCPNIANIPLVPDIFAPEERQLYSQAMTDSEAPTVPDNAATITYTSSQTRAWPLASDAMYWLMSSLGALSLVGTCLFLWQACQRVRRARQVIQLARLDDHQWKSLARQACNALRIERNIEVAIVQSCMSPFVWLEQKKIVIVLPEMIVSSLSQTNLYSVMLHELAHVKRRDHWTGGIGFLIAALCWWNPISWIALRKLRSLQEICCDAIAMLKARDSRRQYAECLLQVAGLIESRPSGQPAWACQFLGRTTLEERIQMIANVNTRFETKLGSWLTLCFFAVCLPCTLVLAQDKIQSAPTLSSQSASDKSIESKDWHERVEKFNELVKNEQWAQAEKLANETASKYGQADPVVQRMLLTSINGLRKSQGLAPILIEKLVPAADATDTPLLVVYSIKDLVPADEGERSKFIEVLSDCLGAAISTDPADKAAPKIHHVADSQSLIIQANSQRHQLVRDILTRMRQRAK